MPSFGPISFTPISALPVSGGGGGSTLNESATDTITLSDSGTSNGIFVSATDTITLSESNTLVAIFDVSATDSITITDLAVRVFNMSARTRLTITDSGSGGRVWNKSATDTLSMVDTGRGDHFGLDTITLSELSGISINNKFFGHFRDSIILSESPAFSNVKLHDHHETIFLTDIGNAANNGVFNIPTADTIILTDNGIRQAVHNYPHENDTITLTDFPGASNNIGGFISVSATDSIGLTEAPEVAQVFQDPGVYFWGYQWAYNAGITALTVTVAGLDCGEWPVTPEGYVFVPWQSDPDKLFSPAYLIFMSASQTAGANACNIDLYTNTNDIIRVVVGVAIGLTYRTQIQLLPPDMPEQARTRTGGSALGLTRRVHQYAAKLVNSGVVNVGTDISLLRPHVYTYANGNPYPYSQMYTGKVWDLAEDGYDLYGQLIMMMDRPYSMILTAVELILTTMDRE